MLLKILFLGVSATATVATNLYVSSYMGNITSLSLTKQGPYYTLEAVSTNLGCAPNPSWLELDRSNEILYCLDEGLTVPNGSLSSYSLSTDGTLTQLARVTTISGPVNSVIYGPDNGLRAIALAHYTGSSVTTFSLGPDGTLKPLQDFTFSMSKPGLVAARQEAPHEHEAILDPTGKFILVPDLGADLVRVFSYNPTTDRLTQHASLHAAPGSGPRHAAFWSPVKSAILNRPLYLYVLAELGVTVTAYSVTYPAAGGLAFKEAFVTNTFGGAPIPSGAAPAEILVSPDNEFLLISNRNDSSFRLPNIVPSNTTSEISDSIVTYKLNRNGSLTFHQLWPAEGMFPRQFSINKAGNLVAVGLQRSTRVVMLERDVRAGLLGAVVAHVEVDGQVTCVVWDE